MREPCRAPLTVTTSWRGRLRPHVARGRASHATRGRAWSRSGFNLLEVIIAVIVLGTGLIAILQIFPKGAEVSVRVERNTRVSFLAQTIMESLKADPTGQLLYEMRSDPNVPWPLPAERFMGNVALTMGYNDYNAPTVSTIPLPGNGVDDNAPAGQKQFYATTPGPPTEDLNGDGWKDIDVDGMPEPDYDTGFDHFPNFTGYGAPNGVDDDKDGFVDDNGDGNDDGDLSYDPEPTVDEEVADGRDNDQNGLTDEDTMLASVRMLFPPAGATREYVARRALLPGDGVDQDGDGEVNSPRNSRGEAIADGLDNNNNGLVDEGIDEEIYNGLDDDRDGRVDEDTRLASFPFNPIPFGRPYEVYFWRIFVGRVSDGGDNFNNDNDYLLGAARVDEEYYDQLDNDQDGLIDEDLLAYPMPGYRIVRVEITWGGDREDNDRDGWTDEELLNGFDDDFDGVIDEDDVHTGVYVLSGILPVATRTRR